jgi:hypothetical protein
MASADARGPIGGPAKRVEVDETLVGGKLRHRGKGRHRANKTTVSGIIERDGPVAGPVPDETKFTPEPINRENVLSGTFISSDCHYAYRDISGGYTHGFVDHSAKEYVRGIHTNSIDGHWSLLKRAAPDSHDADAHAALYLTDKRIQQKDRKPCVRGRAAFDVLQFCSAAPNAKFSPAMAAGATDRLWEMVDVADVLDASEAKRKRQQPKAIFDVERWRICEGLLRYRHDGE